MTSRTHIAPSVPHLLLLLCALVLPSAITAAPAVAVSIRPLQLIASAITDGVTQPALVWAQGQDPHHVSLRPSERRLLDSADLVLWSGPMLERPLAGLIERLDATVVTVQELAGLALIDVEGQPDPHVWVDTRNARVIAAALAAELGKIDPANAARYDGNRARFASSLDALDAELRQQFAPLQGREWAVYHHALRYLERELGLQAPVTLADSENNAPGLRTAVRVREQLQQTRISCMLAEPGVNHAEIMTLLDLPGFRIVDADVMGTGAGATDYVSFMRLLAAQLRDCLGAQP